MAKTEQTSWFEEHIEKLVLAGCALIALIVVALAFTYTAEFQGRPAGQADQVLLQRAERLEARVEGQQAAAPAAPNSLPKLQELQNDPVPSIAPPLALSVPGRTLEAGMTEEGPERAVRLAALTPAVPAPKTPNVWAGLELPRPADADAAPSDTFVAYGVSVVPVGELMTEWSRNREMKFAMISPEVVFARVEVQYRTLKADGSWGAPVEMKRSAQATTLGEQNLPALPAEPVQQIDETLQTINRVRQPEWQVTLLQPGFGEVYSEDAGWTSWTLNLPTTGLADQFDMEIERTIERRPERTVPDRRQPRRAPRGIDPRFERPGGDHGGLPPDLIPPGGEGMPPEVPDFDRERPRPGRAPSPGAGGSSVKIANLPDWQTQWRLGRLLAWFRDTTLQPGMRRQYRMRVVLVNPLFGETDKVDEDRPEDARQPVIVGPWSGWSAPAEVEYPTQFRLAGWNKVKGVMNVEVFTRVLGHWVASKFEVQPGRSVGGVARATVPNPLDPSQTVTREVVFQTGAVVVELDFDQKIFVGNVLVPTETGSMHYLDNEGRLKARYLHEDLRDPRYRQLQQKVRRTQEMVGRGG